MGISPSKRVKQTLKSSIAFTAACDAAYNHCLSLTEHAFPGLLPYQLPTAADNIHTSLSTTPIFLHWVPHPPSRSQIHSALRSVTRTQNEDEVVLGPDQFREWAVVVFTEAAVENARAAVVKRVPIGVVGIVGFGAVTKSGKGVVGAVVGAYVVGVATSVLLSLSGSGV